MDRPTDRGSALGVIVSLSFINIALMVHAVVSALSPAHLRRRLRLSSHVCSLGLIDVALLGCTLFPVRSSACLPAVSSPPTLRRSAPPCTRLRSLSSIDHSSEFNSIYIGSVLSLSPGDGYLQDTPVRLGFGPCGFHCFLFSDERRFSAAYLL
ncbi:hypothetical protein FB451DRAFT_1418461 [Mycena latifolia]|nr:hypothetical protein FB451DRAFT_1418461 [Mycena latifolia]